MVLYCSKPTVGTSYGEREDGRRPSVRDLIVLASIITVHEPISTRGRPQNEKDFSRRALSETPERFLLDSFRRIVFARCWLIRNTEDQEESLVFVL